MGTVTAFALDLVVLALVLARQLRARPLAGGRLPLLLGLAGLAQLAVFLQRDHHVSLAAWAFAAGSLLAAGLLGAVRAVTVRLWHDGSRVMRQGSWLTAVLWLVSVGLHVAAGAWLPGLPAGAGSASALLFIGATLGAQQAVLAARARAASTVGGQGPASSGRRRNPVTNASA